jgi:hypothetical protein
MRISRTFSIVLVAVVMLAVTGPAAQARPAQKPRADVRAVDAGWVAAAAVWLGQFFGIEAPPLSRATAKTFTLTPISGVGGIDGGGLTPNTGSCIDPLGHPRPCTGEF